MSNPYYGQQPSFNPPGDDYDWDSDSQSGKGSAGVYILQPSADSVVKTPSWNKTETVFRPYARPQDPRDPKSPFEPYRLVLEDGRTKFSNWIRKYSCAWKVGNPSTTFLIRRPLGSQVFDPMTTPLGVLFRAIYNAVQRGQANSEWAPLIMKQPGKSQMLTSPKSCYVLQGALFRHNKKDYFGRYGEPIGFGKNPPCVLLVSGGAGDELVSMISKERSGYRGDPTDFEARYEQGDITSPQFGRFIHFFEKGSSTYDRYQSQPVGDDGWGSSASGNRDNNKFGFDIHIGTTFENMPATLNEAGVQTMRGKWREWSNILYFPDEAAQAQLLFRCMPLSACMYAFQGHNKDWIPEDAFRRAVNAESASVPRTFQGPTQQTGFGKTYQPDPGFGPSVSTNQVSTSPANTNSAPGWPGDKAASARTQDPTTPVDSIDAAAVVDAAFGFSPPETKDEVKPSEVTEKNTAAAVARLATARNNMR